MTLPVRKLLFTGAITMLAMLLNACTGLALNAINAPSRLHSELSVTRDIAYGEQPHQTLDVYTPKAASPAPRQLVVFIYGGGWTSGSKEQYYFVADALTSAGYSVAIPDYVKYPQDRFPAFVEDIALSIAWLSRNRAQVGDFDEIVLMGHSAGAHTAALIITDPQYLAAHALSRADISAFIGLAGPYGFTPKEAKYQNVFANLDDYSQMQPLHFASGDEPPMLLLHGDDDSTVLPVNSRRFAEKVNAQGGRATARFYDDQGHIGLVLALSRVFDRDETVRREILGFLQRQAPNRDTSGKG
ncbi:MAG: alpha/beta hydrolase [Halioglobus sp.]|nr:alpha/beta hydrolase [Halioglobus sp.]